MVYLDTNILVYASVNQDEQKLEKSQNIIRDAISNEKLIISTLNLQEFMYTLARLKVPEVDILNYYTFYNSFAQSSVSVEIIDAAMELCFSTNSIININDALHVKIAEKYCDVLYTYDKDFNKYLTRTNLPIEILE